MEYVYDDGGRKEAGFRGGADDCVCRSISIATGASYLDVYKSLNEFAQREEGNKGRKLRSSARMGFHPKTTRAYMSSIGWEWVPTMKVGQGCKVHLRQDELPAGRLVVRLSKHLTAVIDGVIHDTHDPSREGNRCVYGYYRGRS